MIGPNAHSCKINRKFVQHSIPFHRHVVKSPTACCVPRNRSIFVHRFLSRSLMRHPKLKARQQQQRARLILVLTTILLLIVSLVALVQHRALGRLYNASMNVAGSAAAKSRSYIAHQASALLDKRAAPVYQCNAREHVEYWGDVVVSGMGKDGLSADSEEECCSACKSTRGCNVWVYCTNHDVCQKQCWLKRRGSPETKVEHGADSSLPWTSGHIDKDYDRSIDSIPPVDPNLDVIALNTAHGAIRIKLRPDWSRSSVDYVRRVAANPDLCTLACEFYRAEPGFLLQGSLRAFIPPNNITTPGPKFMEQGEIGWAGGSAGPDFFIYLGSQPATHWKHDHTVWGVIADEESMKVVEAVVALPAVAPRPGEMHMMVKREAITPGRG